MIDYERSQGRDQLKARDEGRKLGARTEIKYFRTS